MDLKKLREELMAAQWDRDNTVSDDPEVIAALEQRFRDLDRAYDEAVAAAEKR